MLKRKINDILIHWKKSANKKALLVKGRRQIGDPINFQII